MWISDSVLNPLEASVVFASPLNRQGKTQASLVAQMVKKSACNAGDLGSIPGSERSPGRANGNPLQYLAWRIPWTKDPGRLQYIGLQRVGHDERLTILTDLLGFRESPSALIPSQKQGRTTILQGRRTGGQREGLQARYL